MKVLVIILFFLTSADSTKTDSQQGQSIVSDSAEFQFIQKSLKRIEEKQEDWLTRYAPTALGLLGIISGTFIVYFQNSEKVYSAMARYPVDPIQGYMALEALEGVLNYGEQVQKLVEGRLAELSLR